MKIQVKHIQIDLNPQEYRAICEQGTITDIQKLPKYTLARCPLCGAEYVGHIDTYSLQTWRRLHPEIHGYVYRNIYEYKQCSHFVAVQTFLNLNNNIPTEIPYLANGNGDVPIITPELFIDEFDASAVIHSLPICRIENEQFVPRYAIYVITYYSTNPTETRNQAMTSLYADAENVHWGTLFDSSDRMVTEPMVGKLAEWAKQGKLHWLRSP
ncbi:MAG: hypothetical protein R2932_47895 [Caldilineaceae bacterium]